MLCIIITGLLELIDENILWLQLAIFIISYWVTIFFYSFLFIIVFKMSENSKKTMLSQVPKACNDSFRLSD